jgi:mRNA-degrading endonuclease toxin of MazEF toxin-antitoxin module
MRFKGYPFEVQLPEGSAVSGVVLSDQLKSLNRDS